jgi:hypothetical protein
MFNLAQAMQAIDDALATKPVGAAALDWNTKVPFDTSLVGHLVAQYRELNAQFEGLIYKLESDPAGAGHAVRECAEALHKLRHEESLRLYPVIARGLSSDPITRRLFWQSRLVMLGLARRVFRRFDELARAIRSKTEVATAADHAAKALAEYRRRNEAEMYPLYDLIGQRSTIGKGSRVA